MSTIMCMRLNGSVLPPLSIRRSTMRASPNVSTVLRDAGIGAERVDSLDLRALTLRTSNGSTF